MSVGAGTGVGSGIVPTGFVGLAAVLGETVYVSPSGNDTTGDGSVGSPLATYAAAEALTSGPGDRVVLMPGVHAPIPDVNRSGAPGNRFTIEFQAGAIIEGDLLDHAALGGPGVSQDNALRDGIRCVGQRHILITGPGVIRNVWRCGIFILGNTPASPATDVIVDGVTAYQVGTSPFRAEGQNSDTRIVASEDGTPRLTHVTFTNCTGYFGNIPNDNILNPDTETFSVANGVENCVVTNNTAGTETISTTFGDPVTGLSRGYGIDIKAGVRGAVVTGNTILNHTRYGIYLDAGRRWVSGVRCFNNTIDRCQIGVVMAREAATAGQTYAASRTADGAADFVQELTDIYVYNNEVIATDLGAFFLDAHTRDDTSFGDGVIDDIRVRFNSIWNARRDGGSDLNLLDWDTLAAAPTNVDFIGNVVWNSEGSVTFAQSMASPPAWITYEDNQTSGNPVFADISVTPPDLRLVTGSPGIGAVAAAYAANPFNVDKIGIIRATPANAGAFAGSVSQSPPTFSDNGSVSGQNGAGGFLTGVAATSADADSVATEWEISLTADEANVTATGNATLTSPRTLEGNYFRLRSIASKAGTADVETVSAWFGPIVAFEIVPIVVPAPVQVYNGDTVDISTPGGALDPENFTLNNGLTPADFSDFRVRWLINAAIETEGLTIVSTGQTVVPQTRAFIGDLTGTENVDFWAGAYDMDTPLITVLEQALTITTLTTQRMLAGRRLDALTDFAAMDAGGNIVATGGTVTAEGWATNEGGGDYTVRADDYLLQENQGVFRWATHSNGNTQYWQAVSGVEAPYTVVLNPATGRTEIRPSDILGGAETITVAIASEPTLVTTLNALASGVAVIDDIELQDDGTPDVGETLPFIRALYAYDTTQGAVSEALSSNGTNSPVEVDDASGTYLVDASDAGASALRVTETISQGGNDVVSNSNTVSIPAAGSVVVHTHITSQEVTTAASTTSSVTVDLSAYGSGDIVSFSYSGSAAASATATVGGAAATERQRNTSGGSDFRQVIFEFELTGAGSASTVIEVTTTATSTVHTYKVVMIENGVFDAAATDNDAGGRTNSNATISASALPTTTSNLVLAHTAGRDGNFDATEGYTNAALVAGSRVTGATLGGSVGSAEDVAAASYTVSFDGSPTAGTDDHAVIGVVVYREI